MEGKTLAESYLDSVLLTGFKITSLEYLRLGIIEESGEIAGKIKKFKRGDYTQEQFRVQIGKEIGDLCWYLVLYAKRNGKPIKNFREPREKKIMESINTIEILKGHLVKAKHPRHRHRIIEGILGSATDLAWNFGYTMEDITRMNSEKCKDRMLRGKIKGSGDER